MTRKPKSTERRTAKLAIRIAPSLLAKLKWLAEVRGKSQADLISEWIEREQA